MCFCITDVYRGQIAIRDRTDCYAEAPVWRRAALRKNWRMVVQSGGPMFRVGTYFAHDDWTPHELPLSLLGAIEAEVLTIGGIMTDWPGKSTWLDQPFDGIVEAGLGADTLALIRAAMEGDATFVPRPGTPMPWRQN